MRCKMCHIVLKYPGKTSKEELICFDCRKQIHFVRQIQGSYNDL